MEALEGRIRSEKNELWTARESTGDGETRGNAVAGGGSVDSEKKRCCAGGGSSGRRISLRVDKGCRFGGDPGTVTEENRERKGGNVKGGVQVESEGWEKFPCPSISLRNSEQQSLRGHRRSSVHPDYVRDQRE